MAWTPGGPGRPPGTPNKLTAFAAKYLDQQGFNVLDELIHMYKTSDKNSEKLMALRVLADKSLPNLKSVEISGELDTTPKSEINLDDLPTSDLQVLKKVLEARKKND